MEEGPRAVCMNPLAACHSFVPDTITSFRCHSILWRFFYILAFVRFLLLTEGFMKERGVIYRTGLFVVTPLFMT
jgi:hypothetical protein